MNWASETYREVLNETYPSIRTMNEKLCHSFSLKDIAAQGWESVRDRSKSVWVCKNKMMGLGLGAELRCLVYWTLPLAKTLTTAGEYISPVLCSCWEKFVSFLVVFLVVVSFAFLDGQPRSQPNEYRVGVYFIYANMSVNIFYYISLTAVAGGEAMDAVVIYQILLDSFRSSGTVSVFNIRMRTNNTRTMLAGRSNGLGLQKKQHTSSTFTRSTWESKKLLLCNSHPLSLPTAILGCGRGGSITRKEEKEKARRRRSLKVGKG